MPELEKELNTRIKIHKLIITMSYLIRKYVDDKKKNGSTLSEQELQNQGWLYANSFIRDFQADNKFDELYEEVWEEVSGKLPEHYMLDIKEI